MGATAMNFSKKQNNIINDILSESGTKRKRILGAAGSGKTTVLVECAKKIIEQKKSVYVCFFTKSLFFKMEEMVGYDKKHQKDADSPFIKIENYHKTMYDYINQYHKEELEQFQDEEYNNPNPDGYRIKGINNTPSFFDYIFVDEVQDIKSNQMYNLIDMLKENGKLVVFADKYQNLFKNATELETGNPRSRVPKLPKGSGFTANWTRLEEIFRPNNIIQRMAQKYAAETLFETYGSENIKYAKDPTTAQVEYYLFEGLQTWQNKLYSICEYIKKMSTEDQQNTAVLTCTQEETAALADILSDAGIKNYPMFTYNKRDENRKYTENKRWFHVTNAGVKIATVHSFKGHEIPICIYLYNGETDYNHVSWTYELEYTALTRATHKLVIFNYDKTNVLHRLYQRFLRKVIPGFELQIQDDFTEEKNGLNIAPKNKYIELEQNHSMRNNNIIKDDKNALDPKKRKSHYLKESDSFFHTSNITTSNDEYDDSMSESELFNDYGDHDDSLDSWTRNGMD